MILLPPRLIRLLALGASLFLASSLHAQTVLSTWSTASLTVGGAGDLAASADADYVTTGSLTRGTGMTYTTGGGTAKWTGQVASHYASFSAALTAANYFSFTLAPETGHTLTIESISMGFVIASYASGINTGQWQYSIDSGDFIDFGSSLKPASGTVADSYLTVDGADFDVASGSTVTFRFVTWAANNKTASNKVWGIGNVTGTTTANALTVYGTASTAAVPEPSAYAAIMGGLALAGVILRRRRRA